MKSKNDGTEGYGLSRRLIRTLKAKSDAKRSVAEKIADVLTIQLGSMWFLILNAVWFTIWILINVGLVPGIKKFDPFPFGLLTMIVSLEAIILAIIVLVSQNRSEKVDDIREEVDLQVDIITEQELTKLLHLQVTILEKLGVDITKDKVLSKMLKPTNTTKLEQIIEEQF